MPATLEQRRAQHAWAAIARVKPTNGAKKYGGQAKKLPVRIRSAGLGQALAFLNAKAYAPDLLQDLADWVLDKRQHPTSTAPRPNDTAVLIATVIHSDSDFLRRATDEAMAYLQWLNRFAEAEGLTDDD